MIDNHIDEFIDTLKDYFDMRKYVVQKCYSNAVRIYGKRLNTNIYIRLETYSNLTSKVVINISSVEIDEKYRRQGVFTNFIKRIAQEKYIGAIKIGGVCSPEMYKWCMKYGLTCSEYGDDYYKVIRK